MDNITHSMVGWALGQAGLKRKSRKGLAALILAANMPDIDIFFGHSCWTPLATHRGFTHSFVGGMIVMPPLLAGLLWLFDRWQVSRGKKFKSGLPMQFRWLLGLSFIGALSHPLLDWQTSYAVQLFSPFSNRWFHAESLFILDIYIWIALILGIWLSRRRERRDGDWRRPAQAAMAAMLVYIGFNQMLTHDAKQSLRDAALGPPPEAIYARFEPFAFWRRGLVWRSEGMIGYAAWTPFLRLHQVEKGFADNMSDPVVRQAMFANHDLRRFMRWSTMPFAAVERMDCRTKVTFNDARFGVINFPWPTTSPFLHEVVVPATGPGCE